MLKRFLLRLLGAALLLLGLVGLVVPIVPGVLFLLLAAICFSAPGPGAATPSPYPAGSGWRATWRQSRSLPLLRRVQLAFWLAAAATVDAVRNR